uniref:myotilin-like isoform X3 n=1 Tax=Pristiophorus japonicus TaxID=55135 RepID=UPI00398F5633
MPQVQRKAATVSLTLASSSGIEGSPSPRNSQMCTKLVQTLCANTQQTQRSPFSTHSGASTATAPVFTKCVQDVTSPKSQLVVMECRVQGSSPLSVQWYKEEKLIKDSADFRILRKKACLTAVPEEVCTLVITEAFPEDSGLYNCVATNRNGATSCCGQLTVYSENQETQEAQAFQSRTGTHPDRSMRHLTFVSNNGIQTTIKHSNQCVLENAKQATYKHATHGQDAHSLEVCPDEETSPSKMSQALNHNPELQPVQQNIKHHSPSNPQDFHPHQKGNRQKQTTLLLEAHLPVSNQSISPDQTSQSKSETSQQLTAMSVVNLSSQPTRQSSFNYERPSDFIQSQTKCQPKFQSPTSGVATVPFPQHSPALQTKAYSVQQLPSSFQQSQSQNDQQMLALSSTLSSPISTASSSFGSNRESTPASPPPPHTLQPSLCPQSSLYTASKHMSFPSYTESPAAFLSSVLPSQFVSVPKNEMQLPTKEMNYRYPSNFGKKIVKSPKPTSDEQIQGSKNAVIQDLERKLRCKNGLLHDGQQRLTYEEKMARRLLGAENAASVLDLQRMENEQINQQQNSSVSQRWQACQSPAERQKLGSREFENENESIQEKLFPPRFLQKPNENMLIQEYGLCRIDCKVSALPPPELMWYLNGQPVQQNIGHKMLVSGKGVHSLIIDAVTASDGGQYECVAINRAGQSRFTVYLEVEARGTIRVPEFIYKLQNSRAVEGGKVKLECQVTGEPQPIIFWRKDHEMIKHNTDRISLYHGNEGKVGLEIFPVDKCDAGWYTVSAQNEAGSTICTARLDIAAWPVKQGLNIKPLKVRPTFSRYSVLGQGFLLDPGSQYTASYPDLVESDEL